MAFGNQVIRTCIGLGTTFAVSAVLFGCSLNRLPLPATNADVVNDGEGIIGADSGTGNTAGKGGIGIIGTDGNTNAAGGKSGGESTFGTDGSAGSTGGISRSGGTSATAGVGGGSGGAAGGAAGRTSSTGGTGGATDAGACEGCVGRTSGYCYPGTADDHCGIGGELCNACTATQSCISGECVDTVGGTDDGGACGGCVGRTSGYCYPGTADDHCGIGGELCNACSDDQSCVDSECQ